MLNRRIVTTGAFAISMAGSAFSADVVSQKNQPEPQQASRGYSVMAEYAASKVDYEFEGGAEDTAKYNVFTVGIEKKMPNDILVKATLGRINKLEFENNNEADGDGYQIGAAVTKNWLQANSDLDYRTFLSFTHSAATLENEAADTEISTYDISFGGDAMMKMAPEVFAFVGLSLSPINEGEAKLENTSTGVAGEGKTSSIDFEKEDIMTMRAGIESQVGKLKLAGEMHLISETTFSIGAKFAF